MPPTAPIHSPIDACNHRRLGALWGDKTMSAKMRQTLIAPILSALLLLACQSTAPGPGLTAEAIAVTPLDAPVGAADAAGSGGVSGGVSDGVSGVTVQTATAATPRPKLRPADLSAAAAPAQPAAAEPAAPKSAAPKSAAQLLCEKSLGQWVSAGDTGASYCSSMTRDGGKQCHKKTDCQGQCLARSGTCSPIAPLYGCNDIFEKDGRMVTLCIN